MNILAIESSCDDTAAAVVKDGRTVLSSCVSSQIEMHTICGLADAAIWPIEGLMRSWKKEVLERSKHPENYHPEDYFQRAWSGTKV